MIEKAKMTGMTHHGWDDWNDKDNWDDHDDWDDSSLLR